MTTKKENDMRNNLQNGTKNNIVELIQFKIKIILYRKIIDECKKIMLSLMQLATLAAVVIIIGAAYLGWVEFNIHELLPLLLLIKSRIAR